MRQQLAALTLASPKPGQEQERRQELDRLTAQERELSKQVGQNLGRPARDDPWIAPDEVRRALPADAVLVEIARFDVFNFRAQGAARRWDPPHYAAWVIPPAGRGEVRLIDLGAADVIEADVAAVRHAIQPDLAALRKRGEPAIETALRPSLEALADRVLRPLLPHIGDAKRWVLSPDAALWLVPWAALPLEKDRSAIEDHPIHYVVSGRDLVQAAAPPAAGQALVMADPDYDLDPAAVQQAARQVLRGRGAPHRAGAAWAVALVPARVHPAPGRHRDRGQGDRAQAPGLCRRRADRVHRPLGVGGGLQGLPAAPHRRAQHPRLLPRGPARGAQERCGADA